MALVNNLLGIPSDIIVPVRTVRWTDSHPSPS
jgi:hypothetical protein